MKTFLSYPNAFMNPTTFKKAKLFMKDVFRENGLQVRRNNFSHDFIDTITKGNRPKMSKGIWVVKFGDKNKEGFNERAKNFSNVPEKLTVLNKSSLGKSQHSK